MGRRREPDDEAIAALVTDAIGDRLPDEQRGEMVAGIVDRLRPVIGAAAQRRRMESVLMGSFRDGFRMGQQSGRFAIWHIAIWQASRTLKDLREAVSGRSAAAEARFSKYNFD